MTAPPPFLFSLLNLPLLAGMIMFILVRRPRQLLTWAFAGVMVGLIVCYLADVVLYQPDISVQAGLAWQFILNLGAHLTILAALAVVVLLRDKRLEHWESLRKAARKRAPRPPPEPPGRPPKGGGLA